jgi:DNA-binding IclR family transcriptional regulator
MTHKEVQAKPGVPLVRALERGIALLRCFTLENPRLTLSELARATQLDTGTTRRLLHTLVVAGLVDHDTRNAVYSLNLGILEIASAVYTGRDLREVALPILNEIVDTCQATAFLWTYSNGMAVCIERVRARMLHLDAAWFTVGARAFLNSGGGPRTLLAFIPPEERDVALAQALTARTPKSETDPQQLRQSAARIRERGYELAIDDFVVGLAAIGVPVFDSVGRLVGALSITSLTQHLVEDGKPRHLNHLLRAAEEIRSKLI